jgi:hypothetical protein
MFIQLLSVDIPRYWELIKFACTQAEEVDAKLMPAYLRDLLVALLSDKAQAWVRVDDNREIVLICVTRLLYNQQQDEKYLYMQVGYSWKRLPNEVWFRDFDILKKFGKQQGCNYIGTMSRNSRVWELMLTAKFAESARIFAYRLD